jgi:hypothetical protein
MRSVSRPGYPYVQPVSQSVCSQVLVWTGFGLDFMNIPEKKNDLCTIQCVPSKAEYVAEAFSILDDDGKLALVLEFDLYHAWQLHDAQYNRFVSPSSIIRCILSQSKYLLFFEWLL